MSNTERERERDFERRTKALFDASVDSLDGATRSKLTQARFKALAALDSPRHEVPGRRWSLAAAGALATVALAVWIAPWRADPGVDVPQLQATAFDDLELLLDDAELGMFEEDLDFYAWLEAQPELAAPSADDDVG